MTLKQLINRLTWYNLVEKLKEILNKLDSNSFPEAPIDGNQYARQDGDWSQVATPTGGVETLSGDLVDNTDPLNPLINTPNLQQVTDSGNQAFNDITLGGFQQGNSFISYFTGLFGVFNRTTVSPTGVTFENLTNKTVLFNSGGLEPEVTLALPNESGILATQASTIPITGTQPGNPVSGDIIVVNGNFIGTLNGDTIAGLQSNNGFAQLTSFDDVGDSYSAVRTSVDGTLQVWSSDALGDPARGITSNQDYTPNIQELDFTQRKYVDETVLASRPYKVYVAQLTQSGTDAPVATVLENTLGGAVTWSRSGVGGYTAILPLEFERLNGYLYVGFVPGASMDVNNPAHRFAYFDSLSLLIDRVQLITGDTPGTSSDNLLQAQAPTPIEIRVYN